MTQLTVNKIKELQTAERVDLSNSRLVDRNFPEYIAYLKQNESLTSLDLERNNLTDASIKLLANELPKLRRLNLAHNNAGDNSMKFLSEHPNLEWLDVSGNGLTNQGAVFLTENSRFKYLQISDNPNIDTNHQQWIQRHISKNTGQGLSEDVDKFKSSQRLFNNIIKNFSNKPLGLLFDSQTDANSSAPFNLGVTEAVKIYEEVKDKLTLEEKEALLSELNRLITEEKSQLDRSPR